MPAPLHDHPTHAQCPRCGYDQRGVIATWHESCPLYGVCTECGLTIEWRELLNPAFGRPLWCVEFASGRNALARTTIITLFMTFNPWKFWRELRMSHPIRWSSMLLVLVLATFLLYILMCSSLAWLIYDSAAMWRMFVLSQPKTAIAIAGPPVIEPINEALHAFFFPFAGYSLSRSVIPPRAISANPDTYISLGLLFGFHLYVAGTFAVLPLARRRAKVRWRHIGRVLLYGWAQLLLICGLILLLGVGFSVRSIPSPLWYAFVGCFVVLLLYPPLWWWAAISRYLHMKRALPLTLCIVPLGVLGPFVTLCAIGYAIEGIRFTPMQLLLITAPIAMLIGLLIALRLRLKRETI